MEAATSIMIGDWYWTIEPIESGSFLATHHFLSNIRLQVEGATTDELYHSIEFAMNQWLTSRSAE